MVPETGVGADHNWPQRMTMTTTNVEILRQGWLDAASALAPGLDTLPEFLEHGLEAAVIDERLDEQSLLRVVTEVTSAAADSLPAEELYFLTRRLQRAVYEYLLSLDALPEPPPRRDGANGHAAADTTLIGAEEVAALGRNGHAKTVAEPPTSPTRHSAGARARAGTATAPTPEPSLIPIGRGQAGSRQPPRRQPIVSRPASPSSTPSCPRTTFCTHPRRGRRRPRSTPHGLTSRASGTCRARRPAPRSRSSGEPAPPPPRRSPIGCLRASRTPPLPRRRSTAGTGTATNGPAPHAAAAGEDAESFVKPKDGFHLSDLADFAVVQRCGDRAPDEAGCRGTWPRSSTTFAAAPAPEFTAPSRARAGPRLCPHSPHGKRQAAPPREGGASATTTRTRRTTSTRTATPSDSSLRNRPRGHRSASRDQRSSAPPALR